MGNENKSYKSRAIPLAPGVSVKYFSGPGAEEAAKAAQIEANMDGVGSAISALSLEQMLELLVNPAKMAEILQRTSVEDRTTVVSEKKNILPDGVIFETLLKSETRFDFGFHNSWGKYKDSYVGLGAREIGALGMEYIRNFGGESFSAAKSQAMADNSIFCNHFIVFHGCSCCDDGTTAVAFTMSNGSAWILERPSQINPLSIGLPEIEIDKFIGCSATSILDMVAGEEKDSGHGD